MQDRRGYYEKIVYEIIMKKSSHPYFSYSYKIPSKCVQNVNDVLTICKIIVQNRQKRNLFPSFL